jgi:hypothetical protein
MDQAASDEAPTGEGWLHEIKYDGYGMHGRIDGRAVCERVTAAAPVAYEKAIWICVNRSRTITLKWVEFAYPSVLPQGTHNQEGPVPHIHPGPSSIFSPF